MTPETSVGFDQAEFMARVVGRPWDPWQRWVAIHAGELLPDGRPRFRVVVVLVARQQGKTELCVGLALYWQFVDLPMTVVGDGEDAPLILGTSTKLDYARESWKKSVRRAEASPLLDRLRPRPRWYREANGEQESWTTDGVRYKIAASNSEGGRSLTVHRLICDELRQHHTYDAWEACEPATSAVPDAQIWGISNAGDARSVVLRDLRGDALEFIRTGEGDPRLGLFEYSAPRDARPDDPVALAQANPSVGRGRVDLGDLVAKARRAMKRGGRALTSFKTEYLCQWVSITDPAIEPARWRDGLRPGAIPDADRPRVALCLDVAPDQLHAALYAGALVDDDRVRVDYVADWSGPGCVDRMLRELPGLLAGMRIRPAAVGWLPGGPAAAAGARLVKRKNADGGADGVRRLGGVPVVEIRGEVPAVCMGFAALVDAGRLWHSGDPLLDAQVAEAEKTYASGTWVFARGGAGHVSAVYAAAGAAHLAQTMPARRQVSRRARSAAAG